MAIRNQCICVVSKRDSHPVKRSEIKELRMLMGAVTGTLELIGIYVEIKRKQYIKSAQ